MGAAFNIVVNVILIPCMGATGAAIGTIAAEVSILVVQVACVRGELPLLSYWLGSIPHILMGLLMFILVRTLSPLLLARIQSGLVRIGHRSGLRRRLIYVLFFYAWICNEEQLLQSDFLPSKAGGALDEASKYEGRREHL